MSSTKPIDYVVAPTIIHGGIWKCHVRLHWSPGGGCHASYDTKDFFTAVLRVGPFCLTFIKTP